MRRCYSDPAIEFSEGSARPVPAAYLITFACYGKIHHGDPLGSVDRDHNGYGGRLIERDGRRAWCDRRTMKQAAYSLDEARRMVVLKAIEEVCTHRRWGLKAAHIRRDHVHVVVSAEAAPEKIMGDFKAYASRALTSAGFEHAKRKRWTRHGSTRYVWKPEHVDRAIAYVLREQGKPMQTYDCSEARP